MPPLAERHDVDGRLAQVAGPFGRRRDHRDRAVGLHRVVEQAERVGDHRARRSTSSSVSGLRLQRRRAGGSRSSRCEIAISAKCSRFVPYRCMCRCVEQREAVAGRDEPAADGERHRRRDAPAAVRVAAAATAAATAAAPSDRGSAEAAGDLLQRHQRHAHLGHARTTIAAAASPSEPAAPPPPDVSDAANRTSGTPSTDATCAGSHECE